MKQWYQRRVLGVEAVVSTQSTHGAHRFSSSSVTTSFMYAVTPYLPSQDAARRQSRDTRAAARLHTPYRSRYSSGGSRNASEPATARATSVVSALLFDMAGAMSRGLPKTVPGICSRNKRESLRARYSLSHSLLLYQFVVNF